MEATLQLFFQSFIYGVLFKGKRRWPPSVFLSIVTSSLMITIATTKALIPKELPNGKKESLSQLIRKISWVLNLNILLFVTVFCMILTMFISALCTLFFGLEFETKVFSHTSELEINVCIAMHVLIVIYIICACLLIKFNCLRKFQQIEPKSLLVSVGYFITSAIFGYYFTSSGILYAFKTGDYFNVLFESSLYLCLLCLTLFFGAATFSVEKFTDIWDIDKFNSKHVVSCPRLTGLINFTLKFTCTQLGMMMLFPLIFPIQGK